MPASLVPPSIGIGARILILVGVAVLLGLSGLLYLYTQHQEKAVLAQNQRTMHLLTESVAEGVQTVMLSGNAALAEDFVKNVRSVSGILDFRILRLDGSEAFLDNQTIQDVNTRLGGKSFGLRHGEDHIPVLGRQDQWIFQEILEGKEVPVQLIGLDSTPLLTFYAPIRSDERCHSCHGDVEFRGIIRLTTSLAQVQADIAHTRQRAIFMAGLAALMILLLTYVLIRKAVVSPIKAVSRAMERMSQGDLTQHVPVASRDEVGQMAVCFNTMSDELRVSHNKLRKERNKLTTIILSAREGIVVTDQSGVVVLVNPAAERLLGKTQDKIVQEGFLRLLDDPDYMLRFLERSGTDMPETLVYNSRALNFYASTINTDDGEVIGSAALLRDVTEEKRLEEKLRNLSYTDPLTGLNNRRRMDETLAEELNRAKRYAMELGLMMVDVDHFKKLNDTHGHDMGDRVLQAVGKLMQEHCRDVDFPCRFGGEEFCVVMPSTGLPGVVLAAERLRQKVERMTVEGLSVTVSIGVAVYPHSGARTPEDLLKVADTALYDSKKAGRNRITFHGGMGGTTTLPAPEGT